MAESPREHFQQRFTAHVHSKLDDFERRIVQLERRLDEMSKVVAILSEWHKFELEERRGAPQTHAGKKVIGRIPIWGSMETAISPKMRP